MKRCASAHPADFCWSPSTIWRASTSSYGFDVADQVIGAVAKRLRSRMRGKDTLGRFSGNKFGLVLRDCTPDDMAIAAERLLTGGSR